MSIKENSIITKKDLRKNWLTWLSICCLSNNWERMQNIDYAVSMAPILKSCTPMTMKNFPRDCPVIWNFSTPSLLPGA